MVIVKKPLALQSPAWCANWRVLRIVGEFWTDPNGRAFSATLLMGSSSYSCSVWRCRPSVSTKGTVWAKLPWAFLRAPIRRTSLRCAFRQSCSCQTEAHNMHISLRPSGDSESSVQPARWHVERGTACCDRTSAAIVTNLDGTGSAWLHILTRETTQSLFDYVLGYGEINRILILDGT
jgi:hypothetical protein